MKWMRTNSAAAATLSPGRAVPNSVAALSRFYRPRSPVSTKWPRPKYAIGGNDDALAFVGTAEDFKEEFSAGLGKGNVSELIENEQVVPRKSFEEPFELAVVSGFEQLGDECGNGVEPDVFSLSAGGMSQRGGNMGFSGAGVSHEQDVFAFIEVLAAHELGDEGAVDGGLGGEIKSVEGLDDGESGGTDAAFGGSLFAFEAYPSSRIRSKIRLAVCRCFWGIFSSFSA